MLKKAYLQLSLSGTKYSVSISKTTTSFATYIIPSEGIRFSDINNADTIQIHPLLLDEIRVLIRKLLSGGVDVNVIQPLPAFLIEGTNLFLIAHTSNALFFYSTTSNTTPLDGKYRGCQGFYLYKIYELSSTLPSDHAMGKFRYNGSDVYFKLSSQSRSIPLDQFYGIIQSGGDGINEWEISDIVDADVSNSTKGLNATAIAGKFSCYGQSTDYYMPKTFEYHGRSWINSIDFSEGGSTPKMLVRKEIYPTVLVPYNQFALMYRDGFCIYKHQLTISEYTDANNTPDNSTTIDVTDYTTTTGTSRLFLPSSMSFMSLEQQKTNQLYGRNTPSPTYLGTFYMLNRGFVNKGYSVFTKFPTIDIQYPHAFLCMTTGYAYTKTPCLVSGGTSSNSTAQRIKLRYGCLMYIGSPNTLFYHNGSVLDNKASNLPENESSTKNACTGRVLDLKIPGTEQYFYDLYKVTVWFSNINFLCNTVYGVVYSDETRYDTVKIVSADQGGNVEGWFEINSSGTEMTAVAKPTIPDASSGDVNIASSFLHGFPAGTKFATNTTGLKIRYIVMSVVEQCSEPTLSGTTRDLLVGIMLSPKTT